MRYKKLISLTKLLSSISLKTYVLSKSETAALLSKLISVWPQDAVPKVKCIKVYQIEEGKRILIADETIAVQIADMIMPFLGGKPEILNRFQSVTVDMGAVKFVCNGAKVMRPGITSFDSFKKGDIILVKDQTHGKALAVGVALEDSEKAKTMTKGYVVENLHFISDIIWEAYKEI